MRKWIALMTAVCVSALLFPVVSGCGDDVKKVNTVERTQESPPEMVSPGEPIVE